LSDANNRVALIGSEDTVVQQLKQQCDVNSGAEVVLVKHGFFTVAEYDDVIQDLKSQQPDYILVAMGYPKQEQFLDTCKSKLSYGLGMGVGGAFDALTGRVRLAPYWVSCFGLEWLYRCIQQPKRFIRVAQWVLPFSGMIIQQLIKSDRSHPIDLVH
jgi:N-acetylglucosaminyldiphosphoundecaprenol N-acetyl-beta-D-mannosaminyltransferase